MKLFKAFLLIYLFIFPINLKAYERAEELMWACDGRGGKDEMSNAGMGIYCYGYFSGILDANALFNRINPKTMIFCPPDEGISLEKAAKIYVKWLKEHPEDMHTPARIIVPIALKSVFPCK